MSSESFFSRYSSIINKEVSCRFKQETLSFYLTQELFSSFKIDIGTQHLLSMLENTELSSVGSILDIGCGTGVLAVSLAKALPHAEVYALDRDALASEFTAGNAVHNQVNVHVSSGLDTSAESDFFPKSYDLIVSNLPAKAGRSVLKRIISNSLSLLNSNGTFACVLVSPLKQMFLSVLDELGIGMQTMGMHPRHLTCMIKKPSAVLISDESFPGPYKRSEEQFRTSAKGTYSAETVFDIPGFNTVPYQAALLGSAAAGLEAANDQLFWNPGQGHLALQILPVLKETSELHSITLAGRDLLALKISRFNLLRKYPNMGVRFIHSPDFPHVLERECVLSFGGIWVDLGDNSTALRIKDRIILESLELPPELLFGITAKSSVIASLPKRIAQFSRLRTKKSKGFRSSVYLHKQS